MEHIQPPTKWKRVPGQPAVFLAGGISKCPNWQRELTKMLATTNYAVLNPRREHFNTNDHHAAELQIQWEFEHLRKADLISFWFCKETIQPIALFELGAWSPSEKITIGIEPGYSRETDIRVQVALLGHNRIMNTLEDLANEIKLAEPRIRMEFKITLKSTN